MSTATICDHCKQIITKEQECITLQYNEPSKLYLTIKHYHKDCFNYKFSTDIKRINDD